MPEPESADISISFSNVSQDSVTVRWTNIPGAPSFILQFHSEDTFEFFMLDAGVTSQTVSGLLADTLYQADIFAYLPNGDEAGGDSGKVRTSA